MRVLVVEDNPSMAEAVGRGLRTEGFDVDVSGDGIDGLWRAREFSYDAIVLDIMLPGVTGFEICSTLRHEGNWVPILMLTAKDGELDEAEALDSGADDYLTKPFSFVVLLAHVRALLRRTIDGPRSAEVIVVGDLEIDRSARRCRRGGTEADLTPREFALLEVLAHNPGHVCTKDYLLDQVWGPEFEGGTNVVEVYVGYLRRKIDDGQLQPRIETVHGHGYRLAP